MKTASNDLNDVINQDPSAKWTNMMEDQQPQTGKAPASDAPVYFREPAKGVHPTDLVHAWGLEGPLLRVSTGIAPLDELCQGGFPLPWRVMVVGAPSAGKTFVQTIIANHYARAAQHARLCVGILAVDEDPDDVTIRLAQLAGFTIDQAEQRDPAVLSAMYEALKPLRLHIYDGSYTIEAAANDLAARAASEGRSAALFVDSLQTVSSGASKDANGPREQVDANVRAMRWAAEHHKMLVFATVEANRASYRDDDAAERTNDMAAGAESRSIEFAAQTQIMLRTPKGFPDVISCRVSKNRRGYKGEFFLAIDRETHTVTACGNPKDDPDAVRASQESERSAGLAKVQRDARELAKLVAKKPGLGTKDLRNAIQLDGKQWGVQRTAAAVAMLERGIDGYRLVDRSTNPSKHEYYVEPFRADNAA